MPIPPELKRTISKEEMLELPVRRWEGEVRLVEGMQDLRDAAAAIVREKVVGFDTETRPAFKPGESYLPSIAQVATANVVWIFPLRQLDCSQVVGGMLADPQVAIAGVSIADDLKNLQKLFPFEPQGVVDLGTVAHRAGLKQTGVRNLAGLFLGARVTKGAKTTNWAAPRLTQQQITYAATDAYICRELYLKFRELGLL